MPRRGSPAVRACSPICSPGGCRMGSSPTPEPARSWAAGLPLPRRRAAEPDRPRPRPERPRPARRRAPGRSDRRLEHARRLTPASPIRSCYEIITGSCHGREIIVDGAQARTENHRASWIARPATSRVARLRSLVTVGLRVPGAIGSPLWQDEVASARVLVQPSLGSMLAQVRKTGIGSPAWYAVAGRPARQACPRPGVPLLLGAPERRARGPRRSRRPEADAAPGGGPGRPTRRRRLAVPVPRVRAAGVLAARHPRARICAPPRARGGRPKPRTARRPRLPRRRRSPDPLLLRADRHRRAGLAVERRSPARRESSRLGGRRRRGGSLPSLAPVVPRAVPPGSLRVDRRLRSAPRDIRSSPGCSPTWGRSTRGPPRHPPGRRGTPWESRFSRRCSAASSCSRADRRRDGCSRSADCCPSPQRRSSGLPGPRIFDVRNLIGVSPSSLRSPLPRAAPPCRGRSPSLRPADCWPSPQPGWSSAVCPPPRLRPGRRGARRRGLAPRGNWSSPAGGGPRASIAAQLVPGRRPSAEAARGTGRRPRTLYLVTERWRRVWRLDYRRASDDASYVSPVRRLANPAGTASTPAPGGRSRLAPRGGLPQSFLSYMIVYTRAVAAPAADRLHFSPGTRTPIGFWSRSRWLS